MLRKTETKEKKETRQTSFIVKALTESDLYHFHNFVFASYAVPKSFNGIELSLRLSSYKALNKRIKSRIVEALSQTLTIIYPNFQKPKILKFELNGIASVEKINRIITAIAIAESKLSKDIEFNEVFNSK